jgi:hypothetical protein
MKTNIWLIAILLIFVFSSFFIGRCTNEPDAIINKEIVVKYDTLIKLVPTEPLKIEKVKTKLVYKSDTIIQTMPFISELDTIIKQDTIKTLFFYPDNIFSLDIRRKPDSVKCLTVTLEKEITKEEKRPWWETPAYIIGGAAIGYIFGILKR